MGYKPPYTITSKMLNYVSKIMKNIGQNSESSKVDNKPKLRKTNKINSIYSSLAIENNTLSKEQIKDIINGKLVIGPVRDILEVKNAIRCYDDILTINPFEINNLLKYHGIMMKGLIDDAGAFRKRSEGVFDGDKVIFIAPQQDRVPYLIDQLFDYLNNYDENILIKSCVFHYEFEFIYPFSDGNGRMGRLFQTCLLKAEEKLFAYLPIESIIKERQQEYYDAIRLSNQNGNCDIFIEFMLDAIYETLQRTKKHKYNENYSIQVKKMLIIMEEGFSYTTKELLNLLNMKSRASFKKNYLDPAIKLGLIKMTIPDSPRSRNQKYIKS